MSRIKALIFDFDGLILDTETPVFESWRECYRAHGQELQIERYSICVGSDESSYDPARDLEELHDEEIDWHHWTQQRRKIIQAMLEEGTPLPGVVNLLQQAGNQGMDCAVASSSPRSWVDPLLEQLRMRHHFHSTHCLDDVEKPKPDPALFLLAARALGVEPHEAVVFEDSLNGLRAAQAAGIPCVVIPNAVTKHLDFEGASIQLESMEDMSLEEIVEAIVV